MDKKRCDWGTSDALYIAYHDEEWGVPLYARDVGIILKLTALILC